MNKRKAGEDFYFLHKIIPLGGFKELNQTRVIPSPRQSDRVPFGTGAAISKLLKSSEIVYFTYNPEAFNHLRYFFSILSGFYKSDSAKFTDWKKEIHPSLIQFLKKNNFEEKLVEINSNCKQAEAFRKRFYHWFNGLMVLQYLNESHENDFKKLPVTDATQILWQTRIEAIHSTNPLYLLETIRNRQRLTNYEPGQ
jgi:hypothetical protein